MCLRNAKVYGTIIHMVVHPNGNPSTHFGRQVKKERLARGWSLRELSVRSEIDYSYLSKIESGKRPPTEAVANAMDRVLPERQGWFHEFYEDSKSSIPPGLRSWAEHEDKAVRLCVWCPGNVHGLFQTADYARVFIAALGDPTETVNARLANRMARQRRVLYRDYPPQVSCVIDHTALYRLAGSPEIMAAQMRHLAKMAALPNITLQILPSVAHPATASELIIADDNAAYCEHLAAAGVYSEPERVAHLQRIFATIRAECYRASDSAAILGKAEKLWTGENPPTAEPTGRA